MKFLQKFLFSVGVAAFALVGFVAPANAAPLVNASVEAPDGPIGDTGTNAFPIILKATTVSAAQFVVVTLPAGWSATFNGGPTCPLVAVDGFSISGNGCGAAGNQIQFFGSAPFAGGTTITMTLLPGAVNVNAGRNFVIETTDSNFPPTIIDTANVTLGGAPSSFTVTFDANGGSGTMADQTGSSSAALMANSFTRSGFTFAGWNTAADGTGTAYANGAPYPFTSSATLYAQWTAVLAQTGSVGMPFIASAAALMILGAGVVMLARRRTA